MAEYNLGTARGKIDFDASGAVTGAATANQALGSVDKKTQNVQGAMQGVGKGMVAIGAAAGAGLAVAINAAGDFEQAISNFESATRAPQEELDQIREKALQIGRDTSFGAGQAANAMVELGKAGQSTEQILAGTADATIALAEAGEVDLTRSAEIMTASLAQFRLGAEDAGRVSNALVGAADASTASVESLAQGMSYAGPGAAALGISIEETAASLALFEQNGIGGSAAGTTLRSVLGNLNPVTARAKDAMRELGLYTDEAGSAFYDSEGAFIGTEAAVGKLSESMSGLSAEQRNAAIEAIFGERAVSGVNAVVAEGAEGWRSYYEGVSGADAAETARIKLDNLKGSITILKGTIETFLIGVGLPLQDALKGIVEGLTGFINRLASLPPNVQAAIGIGLAAVAMIGTLGGAFLLAVPKIMAMWRTFQTLRIAFMAFATGPVGLVIAAVVAIVAALVLAYQRVEWFRNLVDAAVATVIGWFTRLRDWFTSGGLTPAEGAVNRFGEVVELVKEWAADMWARVQPIMKQLQELFTSVFEFIRELIDQVVSVALSLWKRFGTDILGFAKNFLTDLLGTIEQVFKNIMRVIQGALDIIVGIFQLATSILRGDWSGAWDAIKRIATGAKEVIVGVVKALWSVVTGAFKVGADAIRLAVQVGLDLVRAAFRTAGDTISSLARSAWEAVKRAFSDGVNSAAATARSLLDRVRSALGNTGSMLLSAGRDLVNGFVRGIRNAISGAVSAARDMASRAASAVRGFLRIGSPSRVFIDIGTDTIEGFKKGIEDQKRAVSAAMSGTVQAAVTAASVPGMAPTVPVVPAEAGGGGTITINFAPNIDITAPPGTDAEGLSDMIMTALDERAQALYSRFRSN